MSLSFLIDEDITHELASALRRLGYDAISVYDISRTGLSDEEQFEFAQEEKRTLVTRNIRDFAAIAEDWLKNDKHFCGMVLFTFLVRLDALGLAIRKLSRISDKYDLSSIRDLMIFE